MVTGCPLPALVPVVRVSVTPPTVTTYVAEIVTTPGSLDVSVPTNVPLDGVPDNGEIVALIDVGFLLNEKVIVPVDGDAQPVPSFTSTVAVIAWLGSLTSFVALGGVNEILAST